jgi:hypothetical protein
LIELEPHESLYEGRFSRGLMTNYNNSGGIEWFLEVLIERCREFKSVGTINGDELVNQKNK